MLIIMKFFSLSVLAKQVDSEGSRSEISVQSSFKLHLPPHLIIPSTSIKLLETIGQGLKNVNSYCEIHNMLQLVYSFAYNLCPGEFGIVYKGYLIKSHGESFDEYLAVKTLKGKSVIDNARKIKCAYNVRKLLLRSKNLYVFINFLACYVLTIASQN